MIWHASDTSLPVYYAAQTWRQHQSLSSFPVDAVNSQPVRISFTLLTCSKRPSKKTMFCNNEKELKIQRHGKIRMKMIFFKCQNKIKLSKLKKKQNSKIHTFAQGKGGKFPPWNILSASYYPWFWNFWRLWRSGPTCLQILAECAFWSRNPPVDAAYDQTPIHQKERLSAPDRIRCSAMILLSFPGLHKPFLRALRSWIPTRRYWWCHLHRSRIRRWPDPPKSQSTKCIFLQSTLEIFPTIGRCYANGGFSVSTQ